MVARKRVNVRGDAGHLEFAQNGGVGFVCNIDDPERVNLLKGHNVGTITVKTSAPNAFTGSDAVHFSSFNKHLLVGFNVNGANERHQLRGHGFGIFHPPSRPLTDGGSNPKHTLMFGDGKLIQNRPVNASRAGVERCIGGADVKGVEVGHLVHAIVAPEPPAGEGRFCQHQDIG